MKNLYTTEIVPGQIPRRFFKSECEILQTSCMSLYEDLTQRLLFFWMIFGQLLGYFGNLDFLRPKYSARKITDKPSGIQVSGWTCTT